MVSKFDNAFQRADAENTGQRVYYTIQGLKQNPNATRKRWIWELLQNAHDARQVVDKRDIIIKIKYVQEKLVFLHNGREFKADEIAHFIRSGSTKDETDETTHGQYGTGLLTTHLLSPEIEVSGPLDDGQWFDFTFVRDDTSWEALLDSLDKAIDAFTGSHSLNKPSKLGNFTTQFGLPIREEEAKRAVGTGIGTLKQCAPYILIFNETFRSINIEDHEGTLCFEVVDSPKPEAPIHQITVMEHKNGNANERGYLLAQDKEQTSVIVPLESNEERNVCLRVENTPRLFKGFPLVDTESFSFPAVINNPNFTVPSTRDSLPLEESDVNKKNRDILEEACVLFVSLVEHAASNKWYHLSRWVNVPLIENQSSPSMSWLRKCVRENLIEKIRQTPVILNADNNPIVPKKAKLPLAESETSVQILWDLYESLKSQCEFLPRREEVIGWCNVVKSWADVYQGEPRSLFTEARDGQKLALSIEGFLEKQESGRIEHLQNSLRENVSAIDWLNQFYGFLKNNGFDNEIQNRRIILDQSGRFHRLKELYRDNGIDKELKDISELSGWSIRSRLRDIRLCSLKDEIDTDNWNNKKVAGTLIGRLQDQIINNPNDNFKIANTRLFAWIVRQNQKDYWEHLQDVPVSTEDGKSHRSLSRAFPINDPALAPIRAWSEDLQQFSELFPPERILTDSFFETMPDLDLWQALCEQNFIRRNMIWNWNNQSNLRNFSPEIYEDEDDGGDHESEDTFSAVGILVWEAIMDKVRNSRDSAYFLWRFLTEYFIKSYNAGLEKKSVQCKFCRKIHEYYPSIWLKAVRSNKWIRDGDSRFRADASSLAKLLREKGWDLGSLENPPTVKLLTAINVSPSDLKLELITGNPEARDALVSTMTELHQVTGGDLSQVHAIAQHLQKVDGDLNQTLEVIQHMQEDENFSEYFAERQEQTRRVHENQRLGTQVENLVRENLEDEGFSVKHTGVGSDFEIRLDIARDDKNWLIEVKSTRQEGDYQSVGMTSTQAQTAEKEKEKFLLCVVPLEQEDPTEENVKEKMLFIQNIGDRIVPLREKLDKLTDYISPDLELKVEKNNVRVLVKKALWDREGFPLTDLLEYLK